jgi:hypothetical protein
MSAIASLHFDENRFCEAAARPNAMLKGLPLELLLSPGSFRVLLQLRTRIVKRGNKVTEQSPADFVGRSEMVALQFCQNIGGVHNDDASVNQTQNRNLLVEGTPRAGRVNNSVNVITGL